MIEYENLKKVNQPFETQLVEKFSDFINSGWYVMGQELSSFEKEFSSYIGSKYCAGVGNGLEAIVLSLKSLNLPKGSEVITTSNAYIASILAITQAGFKPVLVDPDPNTYNFDLVKLKRAITFKTSAVLAVHLYGQSCDLTELVTICKSFNLKLIEDCAQVHGASHRGKKLGTFGDISAFSFYPTKNLGCLGDGGCVVTNSTELFQFAKTYRNYGSKTKYYNEIIGTNSRLDEVQAGFLRVKLPFLDQINKHKRKLAHIYNTNLSDYFQKPFELADNYHIYHIYNILTPLRDELREFLLSRNIKTEIHYLIPPFRQSALKSLFPNSNFPVADTIHNQTLSLPCSFSHSEEDIFRVVESCNEFARKVF